MFCLNLPKPLMSLSFCGNQDDIDSHGPGEVGRRRRDSYHAIKSAYLSHQGVNGGLIICVQHIVRNHLGSKLTDKSAWVGYL